MLMVGVLSLDCVVVCGGGKGGAMVSITHMSLSWLVGCMRARRPRARGGIAQHVLVVRTIYLFDFGAREALASVEMVPLLVP